MRVKETSIKSDHILRLFAALTRTAILVAGLAYASALHGQTADTLRSVGPDSLEQAGTNVALLPDTTIRDVVLRFGGDCLMAGHYADAVGDSIDYAFQGFDLLARADVAMVNLESPITTRGKRVPKPYNFRTDPRFLGALIRAGVDVVNIANNHIYDYGAQGLFDTILYLDSLGLKHVGAGRNRAEAHAPVILTVRGVRIGFLGYYGGGEAPAATRELPGVARRVIPEVAEDIRWLRTVDTVQYIVVNLHWGDELAQFPDDEQRRFAHDVIDAGADAVIGHHPHVLQGVERYHNGVIAYSLGNFLFGGNSRDSYTTALFEIRLSPGKSRYAILPVRLDSWKLRGMDRAEAEQVVNTVRRLSEPFENSIFTTEEHQ
jgi:poly-gamma-glutamate capsule biosynthesis protein CapA/YwtB (metallophosphatase superfamily)